MKRVAQDWPPAPCQWFYNDLCGLRVLCGEYVTAIPARSTSNICLLAVSGISRRCPKVKIPREMSYRRDISRLRSTAATCPSPLARCVIPFLTSRYELTERWQIAGMQLVYRDFR